MADQIRLTREQALSALDASRILARSAGEEASRAYPAVARAYWENEVRRWRALERELEVKLGYCNEKGEWTCPKAT